MDFFSFFRNFRKKRDLLSTTQDMTSKLRELLTREEIITKAEFSKVEKLFEHVTKVKIKLMEHDRLLKSMSPKDKRRLAVLQAELGDVEELRVAIEQLRGELNRSTELQEGLNREMLNKTSAEIRAIEQARHEQIHDEDPRVQRYLDEINGKKK